MENVLAAAWTAYKVYETYVSQTMTDFRAVAPLATQDLRARELELLASIQWTVPTRSRTDVVDDLAHKLGVASLDCGRAAVLSLVMPECARMTDDQYARVVLCAAAQLAQVEDILWAAKLATPAIGADYIIKWSSRIAKCLDTSASLVEDMPSVFSRSTAARALRRMRVGSMWPS